MKTLADFESRMGTDYAYVVLEKDGQRYYEAKRRPPFGTAPSGYTCYLFDQEGKYVDWTWDNWDDVAWKERWGETERDERPITLAEINEQIRNAGRKT
ncbi:MAG: hypothetical protein HZB26_11980 [Candidatus Hydrogenedentes bacterium]|nr:hypothetical protein [Candidatus Hydrogenedentota bacterium]